MSSSALSGYLSEGNPDNGSSQNCLPYDCLQEGWAFLRFVAHLDGADEDLAVDAVVDGDGVAPVEEVDVRVVAVLDLELLTADRSRLSSSLAVN